MITEKRKVYNKAYNKVYRLTHKEYYKAYNKTYCLAHKKYYKARAKAQYQVDKASGKDRQGVEYRRAYYQAHKEHIKNRVKAYHQANPEKRNFLVRKRRMLKKGIYHESYKDSYIFERDGWICGICGLKIDKKLKRPNLLSKSIDHIIPLLKGGADAPINLQATNLICNIGKSAKSGGQLRLIG